MDHHSYHRRYPTYYHESGVTRSRFASDSPHYSGERYLLPPPPPLPPVQHQQHSHPPPPPPTYIAGDNYPPPRQSVVVQYDRHILTGNESTRFDWDRDDRRRSAASPNPYRLLLTDSLRKRSRWNQESDFDEEHARNGQRYRRSPSEAYLRVENRGVSASLETSEYDLKGFTNPILRAAADSRLTRAGYGLPDSDFGVPNRGNGGLDSWDSKQPLAVDNKLHQQPRVSVWSRIEEKPVAPSPLPQKSEGSTHVLEEGELVVSHNSSVVEEVVKDSLVPVIVEPVLKNTPATTNKKKVVIKIAKKKKKVAPPVPVPVFGSKLSSEVAVKPDLKGSLGSVEGSSKPNVPSTCKTKKVAAPGTVAAPLVGTGAANKSDLIVKSSVVSVEGSSKANVTSTTCTAKDVAPSKPIVPSSCNSKDVASPSKAKVPPSCNAKDVPTPGAAPNKVNAPSTCNAKAVATTPAAPSKADAPYTCNAKDVAAPGTTVKRTRKVLVRRKVNKGNGTVINLATKDSNKRTDMVKVNAIAFGDEKLELNTTNPTAIGAGDSCAATVTTPCAGDTTMLTNQQNSVDTGGDLTKKNMLLIDLVGNDLNLSLSADESLALHKLPQDLELVNSPYCWNPSLKSVISIDAPLTDSQAKSTPLDLCHVTPSLIGSTEHCLSIGLTTPGNISCSSTHPLGGKEKINLQIERTKEVNSGANDHEYLSTEKVMPHEVCRTNAQDWLGLSLGEISTVLDQQKKDSSPNLYTDQLSLQAGNESSQSGFSRLMADAVICNLGTSVVCNDGLAGAEISHPQLSDDLVFNKTCDTSLRLQLVSTQMDISSSFVEASASDAKVECRSVDQILPSVTVSPPQIIDEYDRCDPEMIFVKPATQLTSTTSFVPKVLGTGSNIPTCSKELPKSNPGRNKTWRRDNIPSTSAPLPSKGTPMLASHGNLPPKRSQPKLSPKKLGKLQNSYIRKGNSLIRKPSTEPPPYTSLGQSATNKLCNPVAKRNMDFAMPCAVNVKPNSPPLVRSAGGSPDHLGAVPCLGNITMSAIGEMDQDRKVLSDDGHKLNSSCARPHSERNQMKYVKTKSNQLCAAINKNSSTLCNTSLDHTSTPILPDIYCKKRNNQIVLSSSTSDLQHNSGEVVNSDDHRALVNLDINSSKIGFNKGPEKACQDNNMASNFTHVWTLNGYQPKRNTAEKHLKALSHLVPSKKRLHWKRTNGNRSCVLDKSSLWVVRRLLLARRRKMIYTVSTNGFSLRKAGVLSDGRSSLKWSRSIERHSKTVNKEATQAVAAAEMKKREKKIRLSASRKGNEKLYSSKSTLSNVESLKLGRPHSKQMYVPTRYGNQLVRDPKRVIRMLASDKVRRSLHTVRSRYARKQEYCLYFTRFGQCKKSGGCPYIHDPTKVAICTKFLRGFCTNSSCKLTHQVIPERMPDCSYFLQGLCTNMQCPYRHVKVNSKASVCEEFLKGYCTAGDECHRKHTYVCPLFEATGKCSQGSGCKFYHPSVKAEHGKRRVDVHRTSTKGRYFESTISDISELPSISTVGTETENSVSQHTRGICTLGDYICLSIGDSEHSDTSRVEDHGRIQPMELDIDAVDSGTDNLDALIKPLKIMKTAKC